MTDLTPATPASGISLSTTTNQQADDSGLFLQGQAGVVQLPEKLQNLSRSVVLGAQVTGQNPDGTVTLKTAAGDVTIKPSVPLPPGTQMVTVQIQAGNPPTAGAIYTNASSNPSQTISLAGTLNSVPASTAMTGTMIAASAVASPATVLQTAQNTSAANAFPLLVPGAIVTATIVQAPPQANAQNSDSHSSGQQNEQSQQFQQSSQQQTGAGTLDVFDPLTGTSSNAAQIAKSTIVQGNPQILANALPSGNSFTPSGTSSLSPRLLETVQQTMTLLDQQSGKLFVPATPAQAPSLLPGLLQGLPSGLSPANGVANLSVGSQFSVQIIQVSQNAPLNAAQPQNNTGTTGSIQLQGQVVSVIAQDSAHAQIIVDTDMGQMALPANISAGKPAIGTNMILQFLPQNNLALPAAPATLAPLNSVQGKNWPALDAIMQSLAAQSSSAVPHLMNAIPKMNGDLPVSALFFMIALRSGKVENWLGERGLGSDAEDALAKADLSSAKDLIGKDFSALKDLKASSPQGEWKLYQLPLLTDQGLNRLQLAVRDHYEKTENDEMIDGKGTRVTRFVVDVDYSGYGNMQLDGFMREKRLDLVVRTQNAFPDDMRNSILGVYNNALEGQGMSGTLSFQAGYANWIKLMQNNNHSSYSA